jgi:phosphatidylinositol alpha-1,6-mannosyltransferase
VKPHMVLVTTDFPPDVGGIQAVLYNTALALTRFEVTVIAPAHPDAEAFDRGQPFETVRVNPAQPRTRFDRMVRTARMAVATAKCVRRRSTAVILCGHPFTSGIGMVLKHSMGVPYVVWTHAKELLVWQPLLRRSLPAADAVLVISGYTKALVAGLGVPPERIVPITYAPDDLGESASASVKGTEKWNSPGRVLLTVARLDELYKGHDVMMRALPLIAGRFPDVEWVIVGDGKLRPYYERLAAARSLTNRVRFVGIATRQERDFWFRRCEVFVMPSRDRALDGGAEGFGIVFLEASAFGKPVVAGRAGGSIDAVIEGSTGLLVDPENELEVADAICGLLADPSRARCLGAQGQQRVRNDLSWRRTAVAVEDVLMGAMGASHGEASS